MATPDSKAEFEIVYAGPALVDHSMDVRDLGSALLAIGDLCQAANRAVIGTDTFEYNVNVKATGRGSFGIELELIQQMVTSNVGAVPFASLLGGQITAAHIVGLIQDLFEFLKWKRGRNIEVKETEALEAQIDDTLTNRVGSRSLQVNVPGNNGEIHISYNTYTLAKDPQVRGAARDLVEPVGAERGIDRFLLKTDQALTPTEVTRDEVDAGYYDVVPSEVGLADQPIPPQVIEAILTLRAPVFDKDKKWHFFYGGHTIYVTIVDERFTKRVFEDGERFGVDDKFRVKLRITQNLLANGKLRNDYEVVEVNEVIPRPEQLDLV